jgi:hypothetical protein
MGPTRSLSLEREKQKKERATERDIEREES